MGSKVKGAASALRVKTFQNIMIIYNKQKNDEKVLEKADKILELTTKLDDEDPLIKQRCKALFFRAQVLRKRTDFEECEEALKESLSICPSDQQKKAIDAEFKLLEKSKQLEEERSEKRWRKAMKKNQK